MFNVQIIQVSVLMVNKSRLQVILKKVTFNWEWFPV